MNVESGQLPYVTGRFGYGKKSKENVKGRRGPYV